MTQWRMLRDMDFDEAVDYLTTVRPASGNAIYIGERGFARSQAFMQHLGDPQNAHPTVHIAGTSGKGTVAYMVAALLQAHGKRVGLHVSPHVYDIRERCIVNGKLVSRRAFADAVTELKSSIDSFPKNLGEISYFEAGNALAFAMFAKTELDYVIMETGVGGLYDSTNTITRPDKLALITALGYDHMAILGTTLSAIAAQKAGILPYGGYGLATEPESSAARTALLSTADERKTTLHFVSSTQAWPLAIPGAHQQANAALAVRALVHLADRDGFEISSTVIANTLQNLQLPGRFEYEVLRGVHIYRDGAHNPQKLAALVESLEASGVSQAVWLYASKNGSVDAKLAVITSHASVFVATSFSNHSSMQLARLALPADDLAAAARTAGMVDVHAVEDALQGLELAMLLARERDLPVVISGSFYVLSLLRATRL